MELKSPETPHPWETQHMPSPHPKMQESRYFKPQPHPTMCLRRGPGCHSPSNPSAVGPNSPHRPAPVCRVGPQSPVSWHSLPHSGERASECNEAPGTTSGARYWGPHSAMEAMNQSGQPRNSGKRGPMQPAPLTGGGLALEEVTCRGVGPTPTVPLLDQASLPVR